ncbi:unnamed protein product [Prunus armeniaca]
MPTGHHWVLPLRSSWTFFEGVPDVSTGWRTDPRGHLSLEGPRLVLGPKPVLLAEVAINRGDVVDVPEPQAGCTVCPSRKHRRHPT